MLSVSKFTIQSFALGLCFSFAGFSWAIATSPATPDIGTPSGKEARAVGSGLQFSNPFLQPGQDPQFPNGGNAGLDPNGYDLGDACLGSQLVRFVSAVGGVHPYNFSVIGAQSSPGLTLDPSGRLSGALQAGTPQSFNALVADPAGASRFGYFRLTAKNFSPGDFRFEMDRLPLAQVGVDYITNIEACNQDATTVFSVVPQSVFLNNGQIPNLESTGLTLSKDGNLAGRTLDSGTLTFTARATKGSSIALNRAGTAPDQAFTINIAAQTSVQSVLATTHATLRGDFSGRHAPTFTMTAVINTLNQNAPTQNAPAFSGQRFALRLGGQTFETTLNAAGQSGRGKLRVSLFSSATLMQVQIRDSAFLNLLNQSAVADGSHVRLVAEIEIGTAFIGTEIIEFTVRNRHGNFQLSYNLNRDRQVSGLFQISSVTAQDAFAGGTQFRAGFLISNVKGQSNLEFGTPQSATVRIGPGFVQNVPLRGGRTVAGSSAGVFSLALNPTQKFGVLTTLPLPQSQTGIQPLFASNNVQTFLMGLDVQTNTLSFSGDASQQIVPVTVVFIFVPLFFDNFGD